MESVQKRVLITGASSGIGKAIAQALIDADYKVIGTSRNPEGIPKNNRIPGVNYYALEMADYSSIDQLVGKVGDVDILINNAGASQIGPVEEASMSLVNRLFQVNLFGNIYLTQKVLPQMREKNGGLVINISSMASRLVVPFSSIYAATKHGLDGYAKGLRTEVKGFGIKIINICPYGIRTGISPEKYYKKDSPYLKMLLNVIQVRTHAHAKAPGAEVVALKVMKVLRKKNPRFSYVVGGISPLLSILNRILPERVTEKIQRRAFKLD
jgi:short-subunit dehydrogenase